MLFRSKYTLLKLLKDKSALKVTQGLIDLLKPELPKHTLTVDNGKEFAFHEKVSSSLGIACYFAQPYHSWERGLNEHTNGLVRQYIPKKTSFSGLNSQSIQEIQNKLNSRPRKVLGWRTPEEVMHGIRSPQRIALHC